MPLSSIAFVFLIILIISLLLSFYMSCFQSALCVFALQGIHDKEMMCAMSVIWYSATFISSLENFVWFLSF